MALSNIEIRKLKLENKWLRSRLKVIKKYAGDRRNWSSAIREIMDMAREALEKNGKDFY